MASLWKQLSQDMERVAQVMEDGAKFLMGDGDGFGGGENDATPDRASDEDDPFDGTEDVEDMEAYGSPLMGMADSVMSDIMSTSVGPQTPREHVQAFTAAITWTEPFIRLLLAFHVVVILLAVAVGRNGGTSGRLGFMVCVGAVVRLAERLNALGARRWQEFATQNYFDRNGVFMGIAVCAPLLLVCLAMLVGIVWEARQMLSEVKRMKMSKRTNKDQKKGPTPKKDGTKRKKKD